MTNSLESTIKYIVDYIVNMHKLQHDDISVAIQSIESFGKKDGHEFFYVSYLAVLERHGDLWNVETSKILVSVPIEVLETETEPETETETEPDTIKKLKNKLNDAKDAVREFEEQEMWKERELIAIQSDIERTEKEIDDIEAELTRLGY